MALQELLGYTQTTYWAAAIFALGASMLHLHGKSRIVVICADLRSSENPGAEMVATGTDLLRPCTRSALLGLAL